MVLAVRRAKHASQARIRMLLEKQLARNVTLVALQHSQSKAHALSAQQVNHSPKAPHSIARHVCLGNTKQLKAENLASAVITAVLPVSTTRAAALTALVHVSRALVASLVTNPATMGAQIAPQASTLPFQVSKCWSKMLVQRSVLHVKRANTK